MHLLKTYKGNMPLLPSYKIWSSNLEYKQGICCLAIVLHNCKAFWHEFRNQTAKKKVAQIPLSSPVLQHGGIEDSVLDIDLIAKI